MCEDGWRLLWSTTYCDIYFEGGDFINQTNLAPYKFYKSKVIQSEIISSLTWEVPSNIFDRLYNYIVLRSVWEYLTHIWMSPKLAKICPWSVLTAFEQWRTFIVLYMRAVILNLSLDSLIRRIAKFSGLIDNPRVVRTCSDPDLQWIPAIKWILQT